ncbi:MAG: DNA polymerase-3 subunit chi [Gammaproteobacteria bacterium]|jgi:DNA polymerase-3 subunit chi
MTRVDFYQLNPDRHKFDQVICQLCQKAYESRQPTLLFTHSPEQTSILDKYMWVYKEDSFLPHDVEEDPRIQTPILIQHEHQPIGTRELLINLSSVIPPWFAQFERVIELVTEDNKTNSREHYQFYRERGYPLNHVTL